MAIDPEILARLILSRCADEIDDDQFERCCHGNLALAERSQ
jgi:hypothetical protein